MLRDLGKACGGLCVARPGDVELLAGDPAAAERELRPDCEMLEKMGETYFRSTMAAVLARAVREQGRDDEALELTRPPKRAPPPTTSTRRCYGAASARRSWLARARLMKPNSWHARQLELALRTELPELQALSYYELGAVLQFAQRADEARQAVLTAIEIYAKKGDVMSAARGRELLATL